MTPKPFPYPRRTGRCLLMLLLAMAALLSPVSSLANPLAPPAPIAFGPPPGPAGTAHIRAELVAETTRPAPGSRIAIALAMTPAPGWHGYWVNGGDAGFGMQVDWTVPDGVTMGELAYPLPGLLTIAGLMNHVYKQPYALMADVTVPSDAAPGSRLRLTGMTRWLACTDTVCVPEQAIITLPLTVGDGTIDETNRVRFDRWRAALPPRLDQRGAWQRDRDRLRLAIPLPAVMGVESPHLFMATTGLIDYAAPQRFFRQGDRLIIDLAAKGAHDGPAQALVRLTPQRGVLVDLLPGTVASGGTAIAAGDGGTSDTGPIDARLFALALGGALLGGLLLNLMPCVFPILSLKALALARAGGHERSVRAEALAYTAGAVVVALALGALLLVLRAGGQQLGWAFQLQHPLSVLALLVLVTAITLNLVGLFELPGFGGGQAAASAPGVRGGFATGALAAFVATPCSGPFMGAALGATLVLPAWAALPIFGGLGLGLGLPFLAIGWMPALRTRLPRPGPWMATFRRWMALPMALTALVLVWLLSAMQGSRGLGLGVIGISATVLAAMVLRGRQHGKVHAQQIAVPALIIVGAFVMLPGRPSPDAPTTAADAASRWSPATLAAARASGKPVFVNFTADWCLTCKANEATSIHRAAVQAAFARAGVVQLTADWTTGDPAITAALAQQGRNSIPVYLWYAPGAAQPELLPQLLTPQMLLDRAGG